MEFPLWLIGLRTRLVSMRMWVQSLASLCGSGIWCCRKCSVGHRRSSDLALLWLWCRSAAAALIQPLAWELPYATGVILKRKKKAFFTGERTHEWPRVVRVLTGWRAAHNPHRFLYPPLPGLTAAWPPALLACEFAEKHHSLPQETRTLCAS